MPMKYIQNINEIQTVINILAFSQVSFTNGIFYCRSGVDIVVYGVNKEKFSNDAFLVYPESSLGTDHYVCTWSPSTLPTEFAVVSTSDGTVVSCLQSAVQKNFYCFKMQSMSSLAHPHIRLS